jgi:hypothetical protein
MTFAEMVRDELKRARIHHGPQHSAHEGYAVLLEEVDEYWELVRAKSHDPVYAIKELVQVAAMAQRTAEDVYGVTTV